MAKATLLTDAVLKKLTAPETGRREHWDTHIRGLGLRISSSGVKSWVLMTRRLELGEWKPARVTIGRYPGMTLAQARAEAVKAKAAAQAGEDPGAATVAKREALLAASRDTFATVRAEFLLKYRGRQQRRPAPNTMAQMTGILAGRDFDRWVNLPLAKITRRDILNVLDDIMARGAEVTANRTLSYLKILFNWARERDIIAVNPALELKKPGLERVRERVLSREELRVIWEATTNPDLLFNPIVRLLLLTGQRLNEVAQMRWAEIDVGRRLWLLPATTPDGTRRTKNGHANTIPLSPPAMDIILARRDQQTRLASATRPLSPLLFTTTGVTPYCGFGNAKEGLDRRIHTILNRDPPEGALAPAMAPWRPHDLRRTMVTHIAEDLRIAPHILEAILNHRSGSKGGVAGVYNKAEHLDEKRDALDAWARHLLAMVEDQPNSNVIEMRLRA